MFYRTKPIQIVGPNGDLIIDERLLYYDPKVRVSGSFKPFVKER